MEKTEVLALLEATREYIDLHQSKPPTVIVMEGLYDFIKGYLFDYHDGQQRAEEETLEQGRGQTTPRILEASKRLLGYEIGKVELRLMPYIVHVMMNNQRIEPKKINGEERRILQKWREAGHIEGGAGGLAITPAFWNICCELVRLSYVDLF